MAAIKLSNIPEDINKIIIKEQERIKKKKEVTIYSKEMTVYSIIRQYANKCQEKE